MIQIVLFSEKFGQNMVPHFGVAGKNNFWSYLTIFRVFYYSNDNLGISYQFSH